MKRWLLIALLVWPAAVWAQPPVTAKVAPPAEPGLLRDCPECPAMMVVPAGVFLLGSPPDEHEVNKDRGEVPGLAVSISRPFAMGRYEVTVGQFRAFADATQRLPHGDCRVSAGSGWTRLADRNWTNPAGEAAPAENEPVVCVSWDDVEAYVSWLSVHTGHRYRLPSESEWEYAARGGTATARYFGDRDSDEESILSVACDYANVYDASAVHDLRFGYPSARCSDRHTRQSPVGSYKPNAFDLYDMIGNAREWIQDCYTASYVGRPADARPWEWGGCTLRGVRGGSWATRPMDSRSAARGYENQSMRQADLGFRVVRDL